MNEWCRIVTLKGRQVLFQKVFDCEKEDHKIEMIIEAADWVEDSPFSRVTVYVDMEGKPLTDKNFNSFASKKTAKKLIFQKIIPHIQAQMQKAVKG